MLFGEGPQIKNIAADLNKLFRQGSLLNQSVQNVEGDSTADQGTSDLLAARDPVIQEISVGMSGEQSARYTVSGTPPLSLPNSLGKPLKAWSVDLLPYQEGNGDPAPDNVRPIHGTDKVTITTAGKNLYSDRFSDFSRPADYYVCPIDLPNGYVRLTAELVGESMTGIAVGIVESGRRYNEFVGQRNLINTSGTITSLVPNVNDWPSPALVIYCSGEAQFNQIFENYRIMMNFGSSALPYTPYLAPSQTVITLPSTVYTATIGESGGESRSSYRTFAELGALTGWNRLSSGTFAFYLSRNNALPNYILPAPELPMSTHYQYSASGTMTSGTYRVSDALYIVDDRFETIGDFTAWLSSTDGGFWYRSTPTTFAVPSVTIPTSKGTATTWATAEDGTVDSMEVSYIGKA